MRTCSSGRGAREAPIDAERYLVERGRHGLHPVSKTPR
jgi:hypothetical protein